jgi:hypothetical protein
VISREEIVDWKHHPVTMEFFEAIKQRISDLKEELVDNALSVDPRVLSWKSGAIQALRDILDTDF